MKGTSTIHVTEATIIAAVQMYLDDQFAAGKSPTVTGVKPKNGVGNGDGYVVTVEEVKVIEQPPKPTPEEVAVGKELFGDWWKDDNGKWHRKNEVVVTLPDEAYNKRMVGGERE